MRSEGSARISRRRMLKRMGAGAAVAWSAPILTSIRTPAFAQYGGGCATTRCSQALDPDCDGSTPGCPACSPGNCVVLIDGSCFCWQTARCNLVRPPGPPPAPICDSHDDCTLLPGGRCGPTDCADGEVCAGNRACFYPCGGPPARTLPRREGEKVMGG